MCLFIALTGAKHYILCNAIQYVIFYGNGMFRGTNWAFTRLELSNLHKPKMLTLLLIYYRDGDVNFNHTFYTHAYLIAVFFSELTRAGNSHTFQNHVTWAASLQISCCTVRKLQCYCYAI